jgi:hypothetical protein
VPGGSSSRLLVLAEPVDSGWQATLDGHPLRRVTAYGWAQAFELPARGGVLRVHFDSGTRHFWLVVELLALLGVIGYGAGAAPHPQRRLQA